MSGDDAQRPQLIVGDDGSPPADVVWLWVNNHDWPGWRITVVTARPVLAGPPPGDRSVLRPVPPPPGRRLFGDHPTTTVEFLTADGDPRLVLDRCTDATLMAVGPRGRGFLKRLHLGSTVDWLLSEHRPLVPLLIVRSARPTRHVVLCVDGSEHAQAAAEALARLPWIGSCRITVLGICDRGDDPEAGVRMATAAIGGSGAEIAPRITTPGGDIRDAILRTLDDERPDLTALGIRGRGGLHRVTIGSTTHAISQHADCSVLVVRKPDPADLTPTATGESRVSAPTSG